MFSGVVNIVRGEERSGEGEAGKEDAPELKHNTTHRIFGNIKTTKAREVLVKLTFISKSTN